MISDDGASPVGAGEGVAFEARSLGLSPSTTRSAASGPPPADAAASGEVRRYAPYTRFSAQLARVICARVAAGERQGDICADDAMPTINTLRRWALKYAVFGRALARARALGGREGTGPATRFDEGIANEIVARISLGETLNAIGDDPSMPCGRTILLWRRVHPEFGEAVRLAREMAAERFGDLGWKLAMEATPETAYLTHVRLNQLRWTAALMAPRTHGRLKPAPPPEEPQLTLIKFRHFTIEENPDNPREHRVVAWTPNPDTMEPERDNDGPWVEKVDPVQKARDIEELFQKHKALAAKYPNAADDPEGWR